MSPFYIAWKTLRATPAAAPFEYVIHSAATNDSWVFCSAIICADDKAAAWYAVQREFSQSILVYAIAADAERKANYEASMKSSQVQVVPSLQKQ